jgi:hypothetical protein
VQSRLGAVKVVFVAIAVAALAATAADAYELLLIERAKRSEGLVEAGFDVWALQRSLGYVQFVLYLAGALVWTRLIARAYRELDAIPSAPRRFGGGWAVGAWFVPVLNLWRPKEIVNDIWRAGRTEPSDLLTAWWVLFLATGWLPWIVLHFLLPRPGVWVVAHLAEAVGAGFAILAATALAQQLETGRALRPAEPERSAAAQQLEAARG